MPTFKYAAELLAIDPNSVSCPPMSTLSEITSKSAFRFVFEQLDHPNNHMPVGKTQPQRAIQKPNHCELWSLSCFEDMAQAIARYSMLLKHNKNIRKTIGDHLCGGNLTVKDGMTGPHGGYTHYELFEYDTCNLTNSLAVIQALPEQAE